MNTTDLLSAIDAEISRLTKVRTLLDGIGESSPSNSRPKVSSVQKAPTLGKPAEPTRPGRPKGSKNKTVGFNPEASAAKRRVMSPAAKEWIAAAQRARWAKQKGSALAKKSNFSPAKRAAVKAAGKTASASVKKDTARNAREPSAVRKSAMVREAAGKVITAKKLTSKVPPKQTKKDASSAQAKRLSTVSDPRQSANGTSTETQANS